MITLAPDGKFKGALKEFAGDFALPAVRVVGSQRRKVGGGLQENIRER